MQMFGAKTLRRRSRLLVVGAGAIVLLGGGALGATVLTPNHTNPCASASARCTTAGSPFRAAAAAAAATDAHPKPRHVAPVTRATAPPTTTTTIPPVPADPERPGLVLDPTENVANPFVVPLANGDFRLFATNKSVFDKRRNIPVFQPFGIAHLRYVTDALPFLPGWAVPGRTWAPDVRRIHGRWVMYFTARYAGAAPASIPQGLQCIGVASSSKLLGPYSPAPAPVICQTDRGGSIDARTFIDADGSIWLHWKSDDNAALERDNPTGIFAARLSPWGTSLVTQPVEILAPTLPWEGHIVEAPQMVLGPDGTHWLFYSANWYNQRRYGMGVARCAGPAGPCTKPFPDRWFGSNAQGAGPGEGSLFWSRGMLLMAYAPWHDGRSAITRPVALARIWFDARGPYFAAWTGVAPQRG